MNEDIEWINTVPMERLRFHDFAELKSGRDRLSGLKLPDLRARVPIDVVRVVEHEFADRPTEQAKVYRWVLRGLLLDRAIRKVKTDDEISMNAVQARY